MMAALIKQVPRGRFILLPISDQTRGHGTHTLPAIWGEQVRSFLDAVRRR
jgi:homoserine O-acetyltransferase